MSNIELPTWVWDLLADLVDEDSVHPWLYSRGLNDGDWHRYNWCPSIPLKRVPEDMLRVAEHIAKYRREVKAS